MGADLGCVSEIGFSNSQLAPLLLEGFSDAGFTAICHGPPEEGLAPRGGAGVALVVRRSIISTWSDISRDRLGRCIASTLYLSSGLPLRVIGVYAISGSSLPGFDGNAFQVAAESQLVRFIQEQLQAADVQGMTCLVLGDLNSVQSPQIDCWSTTHIMRPASLAAKLSEFDCADVFRLRHPSLRAFTYFSHAGTASRIDGIWILNPVGHAPLPVINSAVLLGWHRRVDHEPVLADFLTSLPETEDVESQDAPPAWKRLVQAMNSSTPSLQRQVLAKLRPHELRLRHLQRESLRIFAAVQPTELFAHRFEGMDGVKAHQAADFRTAELAQDLHSTFDDLFHILCVCLPEIPPYSSRAHCWATQAWEECVHHLRVLRNVFLDNNPPGDLGDALRSVQPFWTKAHKAETRLLRHAPCHNVPPWDSFEDNKREWLISLGWRDLTYSALPPPREQVQPPGLTTTLSWSSPDQSPHDCLQQIQLWLVEARHRRQRLRTQIHHNQHSFRVQHLRSGRIKSWARLMRPRLAPDSGYVPSTFTCADGTVVRPRTKAEVLAGAIQEWARLLHHPRSPWVSPYVTQWRDATAISRGSPAFLYRSVQDAPALHDRLAVAYFGHGPWVHVTWSRDDVRICGGFAISIGTWVLTLESSDPDWIVARRPAPVSSALCIVVSISDRPPSECSLDWWLHQDHGWLLLRQATRPDYTPVLPLTLAERTRLVSQMRNSRPGPSGFKLLFLSLFPPWVAELFWELLDCQRLSALVAPSLKRAIQVHMPKPTGGYRALSMLEEAFKALEGPVTKRLQQQPSFLTSFSITNQAYVPGVNAASEVLHTDALLCEDAVRHGRSICRIPSDYEKIFNTLLLPQIDAVLQARGVPDCARRFYASAFQGHTLQLETKFGLTADLAVQRGVMQGGISSPALSRPAQDPILRLRESSPAAYVTSSGRRVATVGYSDDAEHYGSGIADVPVIVSELGLGSVHTGIGFAWAKFSAFASDWEDNWDSLDPTTGLSSDSVAVTSYDIWQGRRGRNTLNRTLPGSVETLLGKITTFEDKHTLAADALLVKLQQALRRLSQRRSSWDERLAFFQWIMRGAIAYVPLVGLPPPIELHKIDAAFQHLLLAGLGVRSTVERMSLLVAASSGGLQIPSVVESVLAAAASDLLLLLSGYTTASILARDALREVLFLPGAGAEQATGLVVQAIRLLAHYGIYINVQTDRFTSRVLDGLPAQSAHLLVGPYKSTPPSVTVARVGFVANTFRLLFQSWDMEGRPAHSWSAVGLWQEVLPPAFPFTPLQCSRAVAHAQAMARRDWSTECSLFRPGFPPPQIPEVWQPLLGNIKLCPPAHVLTIWIPSHHFPRVRTLAYSAMEDSLGAIKRPSVAKPAPLVILPGIGIPALS